MDDPLGLSHMILFGMSNTCKYVNDDNELNFNDILWLDSNLETFFLKTLVPFKRLSDKDQNAHKTDIGIVFLDSTYEEMNRFARALALQFIIQIITLGHRPFMSIHHICNRNVFYHKYRIHLSSWPS